MRKTRREFLRDTTAVCAAVAAAPRSFVLAAANGTPAVRNLALNRAAWASSAADFINTGHMATDGQDSTRWQSKSGGEQWIYVDLGSLCDVSKVILRWGKEYARAYKIQISTERAPSAETGFVEKWTDAHTKTNGKDAIAEIALYVAHQRDGHLFRPEQITRETVDLSWAHILNEFHQLTEGLNASEGEIRTDKVTHSAKARFSFYCYLSPVLAFRSLHLLLPGRYQREGSEFLPNQIQHQRDVFRREGTINIEHSNL